MADAFLEVLFTGRGEGYQSVDPLRKAVTKNLRSLTKFSGAVKTVSIFKAFNAWRNNAIPKRGTVSSGDALPRI
jgi:hypothetical protein